MADTFSDLNHLFLLQRLSLNYNPEFDSEVFTFNWRQPTLTSTFPQNFLRDSDGEGDSDIN